MFARNLLKLEMLAEVFETLGLCETHGGEMDPLSGKCYVFNRVHDKAAYGDEKGQHAELGFFGARSTADQQANSAYASAVGVPLHSLHNAARRVQRLYHQRAAARAQLTAESETAARRGL